ncbi:MAG: glycosyl hydrolase [Pseudomonas sp.]|jgi:photosystem II stability/assembly factor-like uncharacterized protein|nr:glycosyl hydrolase [Pseudomonas sp.]
MSKIITSEREFQGKTRIGFSKKLLGAVMAVMPWAIIAGLLSAAIFIKPKSVGSTISPPSLERRDQFYGLAQWSENTVLASGSYGKILSITRDGQISQLVTPTRKTLQDIATWDARRAVAVGNDGIILFSHDAGIKWQQVVDVPRSEVANKLNRVRVGKNGFAIATGEMGAVLASYDFGETWQRIREEEDVAWNDVAILDDGQLVLVGEFGRVLLGMKGSQEWQEVDSNQASSLMSVFFRDSLNGLAVGLEGLVLATHDGGKSWEPINAGLRDHLFDVTWLAEKNQWFVTGALGRWAAGTDGDWKTGTLDKRNLSWHVRAMPVGDTLWLVGANIGTWDGERWSQLRP